MKLLLSRLALAILLVTSVSAQAETFSFPVKDPVFKFELPKGWTAKPDAENNLDCEANDGSDFKFSIVGSDAESKEEEVRKSLPNIVKEMAEAAKLKDLVISDIKEMKTKQKVQVFGVDGTGTMEENPMTLTVAGFTPKEGKHFLILSIAEAKVDQAHGQAMMEFLESIVAVKD